MIACLGLGIIIAVLLLLLARCVFLFFFSPSPLGHTRFAQNSRLTPRELQSPLFRWVIQGVHLANHGGRIRYTEGLVVVGEILQRVPVLVVDFIL